MEILLSLFIILHGLVHFWYVAVSLRLVPFQPEMGYSGESWLLTKPLGDGVTRMLAAISYSLAALGFVAAGVGLWLEQAWARPVLSFAAIISLLAIGLFWDGKTTKLIEKGLIGFVISGLILVGVLFI